MKKILTLTPLCAFCFSIDSYGMNANEVTSSLVSGAISSVVPTTPIIGATGEIAPPTLTEEEKKAKERAKLQQLSELNKQFTLKKVFTKPSVFASGSDQDRFDAIKIAFKSMTQAKKALPPEYLLISLFSMFDNPSFQSGNRTILSLFAEYNQWNVLKQLIQTYGDALSNNEYYNSMRADLRSASKDCAWIPGKEIVKLQVFIDALSKGLFDEEILPDSAPYWIYKQLPFLSLVISHSRTKFPWENLVSKYNIDINTGLPTDAEIQGDASAGISPLLTAAFRQNHLSDIYKLIKMGARGDTYCGISVQRLKEQLPRVKKETIDKIACGQSFLKINFFGAMEMRGSVILKALFVDGTIPPEWPILNIMHGIQSIDGEKTFPTWPFVIEYGLNDTLNIFIEQYHYDFSLDKDYISKYFAYPSRSPAAPTYPFFSSFGIDALILPLQKEKKPDIEGVKILDLPNPQLYEEEEEKSEEEFIRNIYRHRVDAARTLLYSKTSLDHICTDEQSVFFNTQAIRQLISLSNYKDPANLQNFQELLIQSGSFARKTVEAMFKREKPSLTGVMKNAVKSFDLPTVRLLLELGNMFKSPMTNSILLDTVYAHIVVGTMPPKHEIENNPLEQKPDAIEGQKPRKSKTGNDKKQKKKGKNKVSQISENENQKISEISDNEVASNDSTKKSELEKREAVVDEILQLLRDLQPKVIPTLSEQKEPQNSENTLEEEDEHSSNISEATENSNSEQITEEKEVSSSNISEITEKEDLEQVSEEEVLPPGWNEAPWEPMISLLKKYGVKASMSKLDIWKSLNENTALVKSEAPKIEKTNEKKNPTEMTEYSPFMTQKQLESVKSEPRELTSHEMRIKNREQQRAKEKAEQTRRENLQKKAEKEQRKLEAQQKAAEKKEKEEQEALQQTKEIAINNNWQEEEIPVDQIVFSDFSSEESQSEELPSAQQIQKPLTEIEIDEAKENHIDTQNLTAEQRQQLDLECAEWLRNLFAQNNYDLTIRAMNGQNLLHYLVKYGTLDQLKLLFQIDQNIFLSALSISDIGGWTPLHLAAKYRPEIYFWLLSVGANPKALDIYERTPIQVLNYYHPQN